MTKEESDWRQLMAVLTGMISILMLLALLAIAASDGEALTILVALLLGALIVRSFMTSELIKLLEEK